VIDLQPVPDVSRLRALFVRRMDTGGKHVRTHEAGGTTHIALELADLDVDDVLPAEPGARAYTGDSAALRKGLAALRRLSRLEWADRDEPSPIADAEAMALFEAVIAAPGAEERIRLARLDDGDGEAIAAALVVDDDRRAVVLALAADTERAGRRAAPRLLAAEARAAIARGCVALDVVIGSDEHEVPAMPTRRERALRLLIFNNSAAATIARTYGAVRRRVDAAREAPAVAAAGARAAWSRIRTAAASVAGYGRFHLYRGELWARGVAPTAGLTITHLTEAEFDALDDAVRTQLIRALELDETYCRSKWQRGDRVVLARIDDHPAGITWCARKPVRVPQLDRAVRPGPNECYIHDVFVSRAARGRSVAASMLEFLALDLRQQDVYKSWALIDPANVASARAFEKAAYTPVADVLYARRPARERVKVLPPDPVARKLLGLP